jgi:glutamate racemase
MMTATPTAPVGVLDSGVGGLSVLQEFRRQFPHEHTIYYADQAHLPYGEKTRDQIRGYVDAIADFLIGQGCKQIIIACNAANAGALHSLRARLPGFPIIGMEPAIKPAAQGTKTGVIGVITTRATSQGELLASVIDRFAAGVQVETQICPAFVTLAEQGAPDTPDAAAIIARHMQPLLDANIDQLVLGCTHFPFLRDQLQRFMGDGVTIIDPAPAVARQAGRVLAERGLFNPAQTPGTVTYYTSGDPIRFGEVAARLIGIPVTALASPIVSPAAP